MLGNAQPFANKNEIQRLNMPDRSGIDQKKRVAF
jgi:hypothetical protein